jgi:hypothetical protein
VRCSCAYQNAHAGELNRAEERSPGNRQFSKRFLEWSAGRSAGTKTSWFTGPTFLERRSECLIVFGRFAAKANSHGIEPKLKKHRDTLASLLA